VTTSGGGVQKNPWWSLFLLDGAPTRRPGLYPKSGASGDFSATPRDVSSMIPNGSASPLYRDSAEFKRLHGCGSEWWAALFCRSRDFPWFPNRTGAGFLARARELADCARSGRRGLWDSDCWSRNIAVMMRTNY